MILQMKLNAGKFWKKPCFRLQKTSDWSLFSPSTPSWTCMSVHQVKTNSLFYSLLFRESLDPQLLKNNCLLEAWTQLDVILSSNQCLTMTYVTHQLKCGGSYVMKLTRNCLRYKQLSTTGKSNKMAVNKTCWLSGTNLKISSQENSKLIRDVFLYFFLCHCQTTTISGQQFKYSAETHSQFLPLIADWPG